MKPVLARPERDVLFDAVAVVAAGALGVATVLGSRPMLEPLGGATVAAQLALALCLVFRRRAPLTVVWVCTAAAAAVAVVEAAAPGTVVSTDLGREAMPWLPPAAVFAAYSATAFAGNRRTAWLPVAVLVVLGSHLWDAPPEAPWPVQSPLFIAGPALLGMYVAARRRLLQSVVDRAERAEREQHLLAEQARTDERSRLAAEMHDVVTHRVSLMVLHAGALGLTARDEATRAAAAELRATGCQALDELRDLVGLLRSAAGEEGHDVGTAAPARAPVPPLAPLVAQSRTAGVEVELVEDGDPALASPVVGRSAYRIIQEALTNVHKHAPGAGARVHVRYRPEGTRVTVRNTAATGPVDRALTAAGSGTGLLGLRQRVDLIGGVLSAGPEPDGGFRVEATLPAYVPTANLEPAP